MKNEIQWHSFAGKKPDWHQLIFVKDRIFNKTFMARYKGEYQPMSDYAPSYIKLTPINEICEQADVCFFECDYKDIYWVSAHEIANHI